MTDPDYSKGLNKYMLEQDKRRHKMPFTLSNLAHNLICELEIEEILQLIKEIDWWLKGNREFIDGLHKYVMRRVIQEDDKPEAARKLGCEIVARIQNGEPGQVSEETE